MHGVFLMGPQQLCVAMHGVFPGELTPTLHQLGICKEHISMYNSRLLPMSQSKHYIIRMSSVMFTDQNSFRLQFSPQSIGPLSLHCTFARHLCLAFVSTPPPPEATLTMEVLTLYLLSLHCNFIYIYMGMYTCIPPK